MITYQRIKEICDGREYVNVEGRVRFYNSCNRSYVGWRLPKYDPLIMTDCLIVITIDSINQYFIRTHDNFLCRGMINTINRYAPVRLFRDNNLLMVEHKDNELQKVVMVFSNQMIFSKDGVLINTHINRANNLPSWDLDSDERGPA